MDTVDDAARRVTAAGSWAGEQRLHALGFSSAVRWDDVDWSEPVRRRLDLLRTRDRNGAALAEPLSLVTAPGAEFPYGLFQGERRLIAAHDRHVVLDYLLWWVQQAATKQDTEHVIVHAGAVLAPAGGAILLPGASGSGKSTLVVALVSAGFGLLSDEFAVIGVADGLVRAFPRDLTVKPGSYRVVSDVTGLMPPDPPVQLWHLRPEQLGGGYAAGSYPVAAVVDVRFLPGVHTACEPIGPSLVAATLVGNLVNPGCAEAGLAVLAGVARRARGVRLRYSHPGRAVGLLDGLTITGQSAQSRDST